MERGGNGKVDGWKWPVMNFNNKISCQVFFCPYQNLNSFVSTMISINNLKSN